MLLVTGLAWRAGGGSSDARPPRSTHKSHRSESDLARLKDAAKLVDLAIARKAELSGTTRV